jgi:hypothetical protein
MRTVVAAIEGVNVRQRLVRAEEVHERASRHASSWLELISPRYRRGRCTTRRPATRLVSTTLQ